MSTKSRFSDRKLPRNRSDLEDLIIPSQHYTLLKCHPRLPHNQSATDSVNSFGARSQSVASHEHTVPLESSHHMVAHKVCAHDFSVTISNCTASPESIFAYHGSDSIERSIGPTDNCNYRDQYNMQSGAAVIWTPTSRRVVSILMFLQLKAHWQKKPGSPTQGSSCFPPLFPLLLFLIVVILSLSQIKVMLLSLFHIIVPNKQRTSQQRLAVEEGMQQTVSNSFHHDILALCKSTNSPGASLVATILTNPTKAMGNILERSDIET
ncbi:unnamed protein product [Haemonchus placei]|uniref:Uncharacterized protein n=1 Tax=Haemonchus placei TaxID=6290 RepID=A0A0N4W7I6_HAEPC|nr:unnamed protein product [Haemonchus placei]